MEAKFPGNNSQIEGIKLIVGEGLYSFLSRSVSQTAEIGRNGSVDCGVTRRVEKQDL